jgi:hypothetical protein
MLPNRRRNVAAQKMSSSSVLGLAAAAARLARAVAGSSRRGKQQAGRGGAQQPVRAERAALKKPRMAARPELGPCHTVISGRGGARRAKHQLGSGR